MQNRFAYVLCVTLIVPLASADEFVVTAGQPSGCTDMEAVAYAPFAATNACAATVPLRMEFAAGATNCAEVVFGVDGNGDGILSPGEERLLVGWDCGEWKLVDCRTQEEATAPGEIGEARVHWRIRNGAGHALAKMDETSAILQVDPACDISGWNLVKVVCRGFPHTALSVRAPAYSVPCSIILR